MNEPTGTDSGHFSCKEPHFSHPPKIMRTRIVAPDLYACEATTFAELLELFSKEPPAIISAAEHLAEQPEPAAFYSSIVEARLERLGLVERTQDAKFTLSALGKELVPIYKRWKGCGFSEIAYANLAYNIRLVIPNPDSELRSVAGVE